MKRALRILAVVPARGGSKGVPRKNIRLLGGKPLLQYTAECALASAKLARVILSTDDEEIARIGRQCGLETPFLRPPDLAEDTTPMIAVVQHAVRTLEEEGDTFQAVCILQPTSPFRSVSDIDNCVNALASNGADAAMTVRSVPAEFNPHWVYFQDGHGYLRLSTGEAQPIPRRQALPPAYHRDGSVYVVRRDVLMERNSLYGDAVVGVPVDEHPAVNIDDEEDWQQAERLLGAL